MIKLQFRDKFGRETVVFFYEDGEISISTQERDLKHNTTVYSKDSPIAAIYQQLLLNSRKVEENLYQVVGAW